MNQPLRPAQRLRDVPVLGGFMELGLLSLLQSPEYLRYCSVLHCSRSFYASSKIGDKRICLREQTAKTAFIWQNHGKGNVVVFQNLHVFHRHWDFIKTPEVENLQADPLVVSLQKVDSDATIEQEDSDLQSSFRTMVFKLWGDRNVFTGAIDTYNLTQADLVNDREPWLLEREYT